MAAMLGVRRCLRGRATASFALGIPGTEAPTRSTDRPAVGTEPPRCPGFGGLMWLLPLLRRVPIWCMAHVISFKISHGYSRYPEQQTLLPAPGYQ